jgi:hypothetical protein
MAFLTLYSSPRKINYALIPCDTRDIATSLNLWLVKRRTLMIWNLKSVAWPLRHQCDKPWIREADNDFMGQA